MIFQGVTHRREVLFGPCVRPLRNISYILQRRVVSRAAWPRIYDHCYGKQSHRFLTAAALRDSASDVSIVRLSFGDDCSRPKSLDVQLCFAARSCGTRGRVRYGTITKRVCEITRGSFCPAKELSQVARTHRSSRFTLGKRRELRTRGRKRER